GVREYGAADLLTHAALGQDPFAGHWVLWSFRVNFVVEVMQQGRHRPLRFVLAILAGVRGDTSLDRQRVTSQALRLRELAENLPGWVARHGNATEFARVRTPH